MNKDESFLVNWKKYNEIHLTKMKEYINSSKHISISYEKSKKQTFDIGFNIFTLSSDLYFRENFHSDIIKALLNPTEKHNEGNKYLFTFIDLLNKTNKNNHIDKFDFEDAIVKREKHNIDILITSIESKKAIIIENKINNAIDQHRQLPRYFNLLKVDYKIEAIVYLTLDSSKTPEKNEWSTEELKSIEPILKVIPSYGRKCINLYDDWIVPSIMKSINSDSLFLLKQYGNLIKYLNTLIMDTISLENFYKTLKEDDNLKTALSIRSMLNDIPEYLAIKIEDKYKNNYYPFEKIWRYQRRDTVFEGFKLENLYLKMDVWCSEEGYKIHFWNPNNTDYDIKTNLANIKSLYDFKYNLGQVNNVVKEFNSFEEEKVFQFIDLLIDELKALKTA